MLLLRKGTLYCRSRSCGRLEDLMIPSHNQESNKPLWVNYIAPSFFPVRRSQSFGFFVFVFVFPHSLTLPCCTMARVAHVNLDPPMHLASSPDMEMVTHTHLTTSAASSFIRLMGIYVEMRKYKATSLWNFPTCLLSSLKLHRQQGETLTFCKA